MLPDRQVQEALRSYVFVEWRYDGKGGKVNQWARQHGDPEPNDPCILGWILDARENTLSGPPDGFFKDPETLAGRLVAVARSENAPGVPFLLVDAQGGKPAIPEADEALGKGEPVLLYFLASEDPADKKTAKSAKACRELEEKALASKKVEKAARAFACFKLDLGKAGNREYAGTLGVSAAPAVVLIPAGGGKPAVLKEPTAASLAEAMASILKPQNP